MSVSIADVAKRAGVSTSTVSYVINGGPRHVRPELTERVRIAILELDYRPSRIARTMVTGRSGAIGVIHAPIHYDLLGGTFVQSILNGIAAEAQRLRHDLLLYTNALTDEPGRALADVDDGRADGVVVIAPDKNDRLIDMLAERSSRMVIVAGYPRDCVPFLVCDNVVGMEAAFRHLYALGHRRIGHVYGSLSFVDGLERYETFLRLMNEHELPCDRKWLAGGKFDASEGYIAAQRILKSKPSPTAIIAANDEMARSTIQCAKDMGLSVPEDLSVVGFDDTVLAQLTVPALTTVAQPLESLGAAAVQTLNALIAGNSAPNLLRFPSSLVVRSSTAPPPSNGDA